MLLVIGAESTVERASRLSPRLRVERAIAGLQPVFLGTPIGKIVADQRLLDAVRATSFEIVDLLVLNDDLRGDRFEACLAQARRLSVEQIGRRLAFRGRRVGGPRGRSR